MIPMYIIIIFVLAAAARILIPALISPQKNFDDNDTDSDDGYINKHLRFIKNKRSYDCTMKKLSEQYKLESEGRRWSRQSYWKGRHGDRDIAFRYADSWLPSTRAFNIQLNIAAPKTDKITLQIFSLVFKNTYLPMRSFGTRAKTGDDGFDGKTFISSAMALRGLALLNKKVRHNILMLMQNSQVASFNIEAGIVAITYYGTSRQLSGLIPASFPLVFETVDILCRDGSTGDHLCENYLEEDSEDVKLEIARDLNRLRQKFGPDDEIIRDALASKRVELNFEAVKLLGEAGYGMLQDYYKECPLKMKTDVLKYINRQKVPGMLPFFLEPANQLKYRDFRIELIRLFVNEQAAEAEPWLVAVIRDAFKMEQAVVREAIRALAVCGGFSSIAELDKIRTPENARIVDQAISAIQDRTGVGDSGWLSIDRPETEEGILTLAGEDSEKSDKNEKGESR